MVLGGALIRKDWVHVSKLQCISSLVSIDSRILGDINAAIRGLLFGLDGLCLCISGLCLDLLLRANVAIVVDRRASIIGIAVVGAQFAALGTLALFRRGFGGLGRLAGGLGGFGNSRGFSWGDLWSSGIGVFGMVFLELLVTLTGADVSRCGNGWK